MQIKYNLQCNIASALNIVGDRWTLLIIHELLIENTTFNGMKHALPGLSANLLSNRLKRLQEEQLVKTEIYSNYPLRQHYVLTEKGESLQHVLNALILWSQHQLDDCYKKLVDVETGKDVHIGYFIEDSGKQAKDVNVVPLQQSK